VRELLNQAARRDLMPSTAAAFRLMADTIRPLEHRQWAALATLLRIAPSVETVAMLSKAGAK